MTAFVSPKWWVNSPGNVIVIPNNHSENLYTISEETLTEVYRVVKRVALAIRYSYKDCMGTSTRQHNETTSNQDIWRYHVHVFPRYEDDKLYQNHDNKHFVDPSRRKVYADILKSYLQSQPSP